MKFLTLFPYYKDIHHKKDVGMIPYIMQKEYGYSCYVACYDIPCNHGKVMFIKMKQYTNSLAFNVILFLLFNSKKYDILNIYHYCPLSFFAIMLYKLLNPKGKIFYKLDMDTEDGMKMSMRIGGFKHKVTRQVFGMCDIVSCETDKFREYVSSKWKINIDYIPNGFIKNNINLYNEKEKIIMTVGRLGTQQKATEVLVEAFINSLSSISKNWKLILVGPYTNDFYIWIKKYDIYIGEGRIVLTGLITDDILLSQFYDKCSIFTMPSRGESFGIAALEALAHGCYLLLSDLSSFSEMLLTDSIGELFECDNVDEYSNKITRLCNRLEMKKVNEQYLALYDKIVKKYSWEEICKRINCRLIVKSK